MVITFASKIRSLEIEKSELDVSFCESKKQEYQQKIMEILSQPIDDNDEKGAVLKLKELKEYNDNVIRLGNKIEEIKNLNVVEELKKINEKIKYFKEKQKWVKDIPLYRDTEESIAETFWDVYYYAKDIENKRLIKKMRERKFTKEEYVKLQEDMYSKIFESILNKVELPEWMSNRIRLDLEIDTELRAKDIEDFLKKELKKNNWEIKISHVNNTFKGNATDVIQYLMFLVQDFPQFKIVDVSLNVERWIDRSTKRDRLLERLGELETGDLVEKEKREWLLSKLSDIIKNENLQSRVFLYVALYEEIWCKFADKNDFIKNLWDAIGTHDNIGLEVEIQQNLINIITWNKRPFKTQKFGYLVYKFDKAWDNWRIIMYPNGEIFKLCCHSDYEKIISQKPPQDKVKNPQIRW